MDWQTYGAIAGVLSFFVTLAAEWPKLRRVGIKGILIPVIAGIFIFLVVSQVPLLLIPLGSSSNWVASETPQTQQTPIPDLWQFYVNDIKSTVPDAAVTVDTLKRIAGNIPENVPFLANAEVGLIPYQYTWKILDREGPVFLNAPEGGYAYIAWGFGNIRADGFAYNFPALEDNAYLILAVGKPDDGTSVDLNTALELSDFQPGFAGVNFATPAKGQVFLNREVVNVAWFSQQLWWASSHKSITVSVLDLLTGNRYDYSVDPNTFMWNAR